MSDDSNPLPTALAAAHLLGESTSGAGRVNVRLVDLPHPVLIALRDGDMHNAEAALGLPIPDEFACLTDIWRFMLDRLAERPENAGWTMQALVCDDEIVGNAGFKGAPDDRGVVENRLRCPDPAPPAGTSGRCLLPPA